MRLVGEMKVGERVLHVTRAQEISAVPGGGGDDNVVDGRVLHAAHAHKSSAVPGSGDDDDDGADGDCFTQPKSISTVLFHLDGDDESVDGWVLHAIQLRSRVVVLCGDDDRAERHLHCCRVGDHKALASRVQSGVLVQLCVVCAVVGTH